jgi:poly-gamma-glutamate capsule biosynthesis protein CapA/YwtB (metallophosphatase superfamily)
MKSRLQFAVAVTLGLAAAQASLPAFARGWESAAGRKDEMVLVLTGDAIINRRLSVIDMPDIDKMFDVIRSADVAFTNFETQIHDFNVPGAQQSGGTYMGSPRFVLDELKWAGFDLLSLANNHAGDYGVEGLRSTIDALSKTDFIYAGVGENLALARAPGYLDTRKGRVALISTTSTFPPASMAGPQRKDLRGRPGVNPLRHVETYTVPQSTYDTLKQLRGPSRSFMGGGDDGTLRFGGANYVVGDEIGQTSKVYARDLEELTASIRDAKQQAEWVVVSVHSHEADDPTDRSQPADFYVEFAHAAIDAGADVVTGQGHHMLRGVEIYNGKPIFYSLGDFIFENDLVALQPADNYDKVGLDGDALPSDYYSKRSKNDTVGFPADRRYWQSAVVEVVYSREGALKQVRLHPIALGFGNARSKRGQPAPASKKEAAEIFDDLKTVSEPFGTQFSYKNGVITVSLDVQK